MEKVVRFDGLRFEGLMEEDEDLTGKFSAAQPEILEFFSDPFDDERIATYYLNRQVEDLL